ncbi:MAG: glutamate synthase subunit beta [bacterium]
MGKTTGFLDYKREIHSYRPVGERIHDYHEVAEYLPRDKLMQQGARCMDCGIPFCHALGCPLENLIPEWNDAVYHNNWNEALMRLELTNNLPEITGRICPAPCETACTLSINDAPVTIRQIELAIIEKGFKEGWVQPHPPSEESDKKIAIIGSGPAGLVAAQQLRRDGHTVTVFERSDRIGGILRYGIPDFKLEKYIIDRRIKLLQQEGVNFETNVDIGEDISARYLKRKFDIILLAIGAGTPRDLPFTNRGLEGIHFAMDYLIQSNKVIAGDSLQEKIISAKDKTVLVIGGGDTGADCVGTANRQGAKKIYQFEILPKPCVWDKPYNPEWPDWPTILRTSTSHQEGCTRDWGILTKGFSGRDNVTLEEGHFTRVEWKAPQKGCRPQMIETPGSEFSLKLDLVILAMGFIHVEQSPLLEKLAIEFDTHGNIKINDNYMTSAERVFSAGDCHTGASLVVRTMSHARKAALAISEYLK